MDNYYFYLNNYTSTGRTIDLYQSKNHLLKDMMDMMRKGRQALRRVQFEI